MTEKEKAIKELRELEAKCREKAKTEGRGGISGGLADYISEMLMPDEERQEKYKVDFIKLVEEEINKSEALTANKTAARNVLLNIKWDNNNDEILKIYDRIAFLDRERDEYINRLISQCGDYWEENGDRYYFDFYEYEKDLAIAELRARRFGGMNFEGVEVDYFV